MARVIVWSKRSLAQLKTINDFLLSKTLSANITQKVITEILISTKVLKTQPFSYKLDNLKIDNDGSYRFYEVYKFRVSYRVLENEIRILRIRHGRRKPFRH